MAEPDPTITVLAGVNGAGKSSIIGGYIRAQGGFYYNPDEAAHKLRIGHPALDPAQANGLAWQQGKEGLDKAIAERHDYVFETTLGGQTIVQRLMDAADQGMAIQVWYVGLDGVEAHIRRVNERVDRGGHAIPEATIRARYQHSRENLLMLLPYVHELRVFDNTVSVNLAAGEPPAIKSLLHVKAGTVHQMADLQTIPDWAKPVVMAAMKMSKT